MALDAAHRVDTDLVAAVISFAKDPNKYSTYLNDIRREIESLEKMTAKYHSYKDAEEFIKIEMIKLEDLSKMLTGLKTQLEERSKQQNTEYEDFKVQRSKFLTEHRSDKEALQRDKEEFETVKAEVLVADKRNKEYATTLHQRMQSVNERESKFSAKFTALQELMKG